MSKKYTSDQMIKWLKDYFTTLGYEVDDYAKQFRPARVPLYCVKKQNSEIIEEIIIDITEAETISKEDFFPSLEIPDAGESEAGSLEIPEASTVRFYQYYFPRAKVFFAYSDIVKEEGEFDKFKKVCEKREIGLLRTSEIKTEEVAKARSLFDQLCDLIIESKKSRKEIEEIIGDHLDSYLHFLVYYPDPIYRRRAIAAREEETKGTISFKLIDKQLELSNIVYGGSLKKLAREYRQKTGDDYDIAERCTSELWKKYLGLEYPSLQRRVESILQRNEKYREHFVHQFKVFLIGVYILDAKYPEIAKKFEEKYECRIEIVWLIASTFHDFNYGLQNFDEWIQEFFKDALRIKNKQTRESLNLLNLDAAIIREALFEKVTEISEHLSDNPASNSTENLVNFLYEKTVTDRNHGVLSAVSLLKLYDESDEQNRKINHEGMLEAAVAIGCHDEDILEAICGCQGYRRSSSSLPIKDDECAKECRRNQLLWPQKKSRIFKENLSTNGHNGSCEYWEREFMKVRGINKVKFEDYPILFLLVFCDTVQDEGRIKQLDIGLSEDRSNLRDIVIDKKGTIVTVDVLLESEEQAKKEGEIERVAWCLKDNNFRICVNEREMKMNGSGGN